MALARRIARSTLDLDVCSLGELLTAERAGMPAERLVMHGCGKTRAELEAACDGRVGRIVVDHFEELRALAAIGRGPRHGRTRVLLRINTGIEARTHAYVRTGGEDSKFGFALRDLDAAVAAVLAVANLELAGIHSHLGSQIFEGDAYAASLPIVVDAYARARALGAPVTDLVIGGGFGVDAKPAGERIDVLAVLGELAANLHRIARERGMPAPRMGIEPGRSVVANAGTSLYRVVACKSHGSRRFAIVDGGIADNPRPALYGAYHHPTLANRRSTATSHETTVCGRSCENDRLVVANLPDDLVAGDVLALGTTGAYTYSMASNYNRFPKPAVVFAGDGRHRLVVRRECEDDVLRHDVIDTVDHEIPSTTAVPSSV
ncbi:MAG: diaminopimelate decarboxylase [Vulcanimicrobiaceae bacterium]